MWGENEAERILDKECLSEAITYQACCAFFCTETILYVHFLQEIRLEPSQWNYAGLFSFGP